VPAEEREQILWRNAAQLYRIETRHSHL
jgi:predicted TIM-barrel fold metal-dependent hydrolase